MWTGRGNLQQARTLLEEGLDVVRAAGDERGLGVNLVKRNIILRVPARLFSAECRQRRR